MVAGPHNFALEQGASFRLALTWNQPVVGTNPPVPFDLTGAHAHLQLRPNVGGAVLADLSDVGGGITLGGTAGTIALLFTSAQTEALVVKRAVYDLFVSFPNGEVTRVLAGKATIEPAVTQPVVAP